jgi:hypothetical protein
MKGGNFIFSKLGECVHTVFRIVSNMFFKFKAKIRPGIWARTIPLNATRTCLPAALTLQQSDFFFGGYLKELAYARQPIVSDSEIFNT